VGLVYEQRKIEPLLQRDDLGQRGEVAVHREQRVGDDEKAVSGNPLSPTLYAPGGRRRRTLTPTLSLITGRGGRTLTPALSLITGRGRRTLTPALL
jgi:hypothetical protein